ncbi:MAG: WbqC family protein [Lysobacter sp.]
MKRVAILQSNYIPWKGYFDLLSMVDEFIVFDSAQYTKNDWRNRNQIKSANGKVWLTVPVRHRGMGQAIDEVELSEPRCFAKHWSTFRQNYAKATCIKYCEAALEPVFQSAAGLRTISEANLHFLTAIAGLLGIDTRISNARQYQLLEDRNDRLVSLCVQAGATHYLSGPAARVYIDESRFASSGITVEWADYSGYDEYPQPHPPFDHHVSIIDLLACTGEQAHRHLGRTTR